MSEDEMVGWHHRLNEHEFEQTPRDGTVLRHLGLADVKSLSKEEGLPTEEII